MEDMKKVCLLAFVLFTWSIVVNAQESDGRYVEVTGSSEIEVVPDGFIFWFRLRSIGKKNTPVNQKKKKIFIRKCHWQ